MDPSVQARREWWCFDNPFGGMFAVFLNNNEIAATSYMGGKVLDRAGAVIKGFEIGETATSPAHQRCGLFSKLVKTSQKFANQIENTLIYGTPNSQSTPGYRKLDFDIIEGQQSFLFLIPNINYLLPFYLGKRDSKEISFEAYAEQTSDFSRLNHSTPQYLQWRFEGSPSNYRYFMLQRKNEEWFLAFKYGSLGARKTLICSEVYCNGAHPGIENAAPIIRAVAGVHYSARSFQAIQIHGAFPDERSPFALKIKRILPHRILPICAFGNTNATERDWFGNFQLSDCDIE